MPPNRAFATPRSPKRPATITSRPFWSPVAERRSTAYNFSAGTSSRHLPPAPPAGSRTPRAHRHLPPAAERRERTGVQALGPAAILAQNPQSRPLKTKRSPAPAVHAASSAVRRELRNAYFLFVSAYRAAAEKLRAGQCDAPFPMGCFPPPLPFVGG